MKKTPSIKPISLDEATNYISQDDDVQNSTIHYFTMTPLDTPPGVDGSWDVTYYTRRPKKTVPTDGMGDDIIYVLSNITEVTLLGEYPI